MSAARPLARLRTALAVAEDHGGWSRFEVAPDGSVRVYAKDAATDDPPAATTREEEECDRAFGLRG